MWLDGIYFQLRGSLAPGKELQDSFKRSRWEEAEVSSDNCLLLSLSHRLKAKRV